MPETGREVCLTQRQIDILQVFIKDKELDDTRIAEELVSLAFKLGWGQVTEGC